MRRLIDFVRPQAKLSDKGSAAIAEVHALVAEWDRGRLPIAEVAKLSTGRQRNLAVMHTDRDDPRFWPLMRCLDALIAAQRGPRGDAVVTKHGLFERQDLIDAQVAIEREDGRERIVFPVAYPGGRGVFRPKAQRGAQVRPFSVAPHASSAKEEEEWYEA